MRTRFRPLTAALAAFALTLAASPAARAQTLLSASVDPPHANTGDRFVLHAASSLPRDCAWTAQARAGFGPQPEIGTGPGWGIDLTLIPGTTECVAGTITFDSATDLGLLAVASGPVLVRLHFDGQVSTLLPGTLTVDPGAAPGFTDPAADWIVQVFVQSAGLTSVDADNLAISDTLHREIDVFDPIAEVVSESFSSPGNGNVRALVVDGTQFYAAVMDTTGPRLYRVARHGGVLDVFPSPGLQPNPQALEGLAWRDGLLYGAYPNPPLLFAIDPGTHQLLWQRALPVRMTGLVGVPGGLLGVDPGGNFYLVDAEQAGGARLIADPVDTGLPAVADDTDIAWDGRGLFVFDQQQSMVRRVRSYALWWAADGTLRAYAPPALGPVDVLRGDLAAVSLGASSVDLGPTTCLMADGAGGVVSDPAGPPAVGKGFFYLARFRGADGFETSWGRASNGFRRLESVSACP
jgi:hypothetical protein